MGDTSQATLESASKELGCDSVHQFVVAWCIGRGAHVVVQTSSVAHLKEALNAAEKVSNNADGGTSLQEIDGNEMVAMCGGVDETAMYFKSMVASEKE